MMQSPLKWLLIVLIRGYQLCISPFIGQNCRFYPSCSQYAIEAISVHGCLKGCYLTFIRLCKCHPLHPGGVDPVPARKSGCACSSSLKNDDKDI
ncbi:membrane protein insertion efficiency factor YidD [Oxalobacter formigenes OXCC13]|nr:membrane protein insertion efficiency factor YidD [Oxalobacter formigenes OXCC13]